MITTPWPWLLLFLVLGWLVEFLLDALFWGRRSRQIRTGLLSERDQLTKLDARVIELNGHLDTLTEDLDETRIAKAQTAVANTQLARQVTQKSQAVTQIQAQQQAGQTPVKSEGMQTELSAVLSKSDQLEAELTALTQQINDAQPDIDALTTKNDQLTEQVTAVQRRWQLQAQAEAELEAVLTERQNSLVAVREQSAEMDALRRQLVLKDREIAQLQGRLS